MKTLFRASLLGIFAAAGMGLAVSFAVLNETGAVAESTPESLRPTPAERSKPSPDEDIPAQKEDTVQPAIADASPPVNPLEQRVIAPWPAVYHPPVTSQLTGIADAIRTMQVQQERTAHAVRRLREEIPPPDSMTPPPAPTDVSSDEAPPEPQIHAGEGDDNLVMDFQDSDIREVLKLISEASGLNILASPNVTGTVSASLRGVNVETTLQAILKSSGFVDRRDGEFVFVGTPADLDEMDQKQDQLATRIYRPNFVTAEELQNLIAPLITDGFGTVVVSSAAEQGIASDKAATGGDAFAGAEVVLVRDYETVLDGIDAIVAQVDVPPREVVIEAMILSVKLDDTSELGVDFELLRNKDTIRIVSGEPLSSLVTTDFTDGLKVGFLDASTFAFVEALETIGDTDVIATPRVMCLNKQRAEIHIGSELGYVSTTVTETAAMQTVEFLEVGTHLLIRPFISSDNLIRLEVHPELSTGSVKVQQGFTLPDKEVTQVTTNVLCPDQATVVIGGLIREDLSTTATQIPVLGSLPWIGFAFRQSVEAIERREIIVLLTPRIVDIPAMVCEGQRTAEQFLDRRNVFSDKMSCLGTRHWAERYSRLANAAWAAGDADIALRYSNLAIQFDPLHQGAINLRREILSMNPNLEYTVDEHLHRGLGPLDLPHRDYSRHGYPWQMQSSGEVILNIRDDVHHPDQPVEVFDLSDSGSVEGGGSRERSPEWRVESPE